MKFNLIISSYKNKYFVINFYYFKAYLNLVKTFIYKYCLTLINKTLFQ